MHQLSKRILVTDTTDKQTNNRLREMDDDEHEEQTMIDYDESLTIVELVNQGWDWFWGQNELTYDKHLNIVRSETPRVRPKVWFNHINEK